MTLKSSFVSPAARGSRLRHGERSTGSDRPSGLPVGTRDRSNDLIGMPTPRQGVVARSDDAPRALPSREAPVLPQRVPVRPPVFQPGALASIPEVDEERGTESNDRRPAVKTRAGPVLMREEAPPRRALDRRDSPAGAADDRDPTPTELPAQPRRLPSDVWPTFDTVEAKPQVAPRQATRMPSDLWPAFEAAAHQSVPAPRDAGPSSRIGTGPTSSSAQQTRSDSAPAAPAYVLADGRKFTSVNALSPEDRAAFLAVHDPVQQFGLTDDTLLYRTTEKQWVKGSRIRGNPNSCARIANHLAVVDNPVLKDPVTLAQLGPQARHAVLTDRGARFHPVDMRATDLQQPTLNVMAGPNGKSGATAYAQGPEYVVVSMRLGDLRKAGGGEVFLDVSSVARSDKMPALIVTMPDEKAVPVKILPKR